MNFCSNLFSFHVLLSEDSRVSFQPNLPNNNLWQRHPTSFGVFLLETEGSFRGPVEKEIRDTPRGELNLQGEVRFPNISSELTGNKNMLSIFFIIETEGTSRWAFSPFFLKVIPNENFMMENCPREEVNFREAFDNPNAFPKSWILIFCSAREEVITS